jgi:hypothetical protein
MKGSVYMEIVILSMLAFIASILFAINKVLVQIDLLLGNYMEIDDKIQKIKKHPKGHSDVSDID